MRDIANITKSLWEIARKISSDEYLQRLLLDDSVDLSSKSFSIKTLNELIKDKYVSFSPYVDSALHDFTRNTFIVILPTTINFSDNGNTYAYFSIFCVTDLNHVLLTDNRLRLLEMVNKLCNLLDGLKLTAAGEIRINQINRTAITETLEGYKIDLTISDQISEEEKFDL